MNGSAIAHQDVRLARGSAGRRRGGLQDHDNAADGLQGGVDEGGGAGSG